MASRRGLFRSNCDYSFRLCADCQRALREGVGFQILDELLQACQQLSLVRIDAYRAPGYQGAFDHRYYLFLDIPVDLDCLQTLFAGTWSSATNNSCHPVFLVAPTV